MMITLADCLQDYLKSGINEETVREQIRRNMDAFGIPPGGCVIGARPIDLHLKGLSALGAKLTIQGGYVNASAPKLVGTELFLGGRSGPTVLGTANVMMAAVLAKGTTRAYVTASVADPAGNLYAAENTLRGVTKYAKR